MPDTVIEDYIQRDTYAAFDEITTVFRHDYVQYMGMLHSWMSLIEMEALEAPASAFSTAGTMQAFQRDIQLVSGVIASTFQETTALLHPVLAPVQMASKQATAAYIQTAWENFFHDFVKMVLPRLQMVEKATREFTRQPEFQQVIEGNLGKAAGEPVAILLARCYERTYQLLQADTFDKRMGEILQSGAGC